MVRFWSLHNFASARHISETVLCESVCRALPFIARSPYGYQRQSYRHQQQRGGDEDGEIREENGWETAALNQTWSAGDTDQQDLGQDDNELRSYTADDIQYGDRSDIDQGESCFKLPMGVRSSSSLHIIMYVDLVSTLYDIGQFKREPLQVQRA